MGTAFYGIALNADIALHRGKVIRSAIVQDAEQQSRRRKRGRVMEISEAIERLEYLQAKAQIALEQEMPEWVAEDILGTIEAYDIAIEALRKFENSSEKPNKSEIPTGSERSSE